ncbi:MAG TPA: glycosyltransferase family 1 protein [Roseiflexaceae bacterium]|nr:glycosyltransferase family 1 protein [Roseiflexaceae bacterium]
MDRSAAPAVGWQSMLRIAIFTETFLPKLDGIVSILCLALRHLNERGHQAMVIGPPDMPPEYAGARCIGTGGPRFPLYPEVRINLPNRRIGQALRAFRPDLIHVVNPIFLGPAGIAFARWYKLPLVASYHTDIPGYAKFYGFPWGEDLLWWLFRSLHNSADLNLVPSTYILRQVRAHGFRRVRWWRRGVDTERFRPMAPDPAMRARLTDGHPDDFLALYVGRIAKEKGVERLREPLARLPGARLALVGGGPEFEQVRALYAGAPVVFTGFLDGDELVSAFASADALVFPSTNETFGLVALEAMACGLPVIAGMSGGLVDVLDDSVNALVCNPLDPDSIAECLRRLQHSPELRARLRHGALTHARGRSWRATMDQLIDYYRLAMRAHRLRLAA